MWQKDQIGRLFGREGVPYLLQPGLAYWGENFSSRCWFVCALVLAIVMTRRFSGPISTQEAYQAYR